MAELGGGHELWVLCLLDLGVFEIARDHVHFIFLILHSLGLVHLIQFEYFEEEEFRGPILLLPLP